MTFKKIFRAALLVAATFTFLGANGVSAATPEGFSLQVTPSPLTATLKPGLTSSLEVKIRNTGTQAEELKIEPRSFSFDSATQQVKFDDTTPPPIAPWIKFASPTFTIQPGQWFTQKIDVALPKEAGFSYPFALLISRTNEPANRESGRAIQGSVAIFTLINVDRPDAVRQLEVTSLSAGSQIHEQLPVPLKLRIKNTGNTIAQPAGNIFIQRDSNSNNPISTLQINQNSGYILPGTEREFTINWEDGFKGDLGSITKMRFGQYVAKAIVVYDDGKRDMVLEKETSFWVVPWKLMLIGLVVVTLLAIGVWSFINKVVKASKRSKPMRFPKR